MVAKHIALPPSFVRLVQTQPLPSRSKRRGERLSPHHGPVVACVSWQGYDSQTAGDLRGNASSRPQLFFPQIRSPLGKLHFPNGTALLVDLQVQLGRLALPNPILVASGTFGYAREMAGLVQLSRLGAILPKTITSQPRPGNRPWRTVETTGGLLNSIGLDNDGIDAFIENHLPYLTTVGSPIIVSVAGSNHDDFVQLAERIGQQQGVAAVELNISCPNVAHGVDFGANPELCRKLVTAIRERCPIPIIAKLTPNVTSIADIARAATDGGADALSVINTVLGMAIDWRKRRPMLGNIVGGLSGPAIKPVALRCVYQVAAAVKTPIIGIGGIGSIDDVMEFLIAGATAVQIGTANYVDPTVSTRVLDELPAALKTLGAQRVSDVVGTLDTKPR
jgi:dihydroorotate dehydrogenase (NAD+) catalytic subunit